jgi:DNA repair protein RadA/Sms
MARDRTIHVCRECGAEHGRWQGWCKACGVANSLDEDVAPKPTSGGRLSQAQGLAFTGLEAATTETPRLKIGVAELDRVVGGGLVAGSAILIGGDPGIGKSTLLLQAVARLALAGVDCVYVSGEEAPGQVGLRARRLGLTEAPVRLASANNVRDILKGLAGDRPPGIVVIDSIQTMFTDALESAPGTVAQVRASANELIRYAKKSGAVVVLVGHVTKDGQIAGPRVLEHMVDCVLYFEGDRGHQFRILRAVKNRFGPTDEIGVFEMTDGGLKEVANPSSLFLGERGRPISGTTVFAGIEGSRPLLSEIQALVAPSPLATPRRTVVGWDTGRLAMVLAVLEARCGLALAGNDVYLNVAGGLRIVEPAADLAVATALVSSVSDQPAPADGVIFGEISLSGEVRQVAQTEQRLKEATKLGFERALMPAGGRSGRDVTMSVMEISHLRDMVQLFEAPS